MGRGRGLGLLQDTVSQSTSKLCIYTPGPFRAFSIVTCNLEEPHVRSTTVILPCCIYLSALGRGCHQDTSVEATERTAGTITVSGSWAKARASTDDPQGAAQGVALIVVTGTAANQSGL
ncbi:MAG: hypothetical protein RL701_2426 [Pseudomonadota bacterium]|jgi:hypothetical protein